MAELGLIGALIYRCEGTKRGNYRMVELVNSDPEIISVFIKFLLKEMLVPKEKIRIRLYLHSDDNPIKAIKYWSRITGIRTNQFRKNFIKKDGARKGKLINGTCVIGVHSKEFFEKVITLSKNVFAGLQI